jgi:hypothetical protein
MARLVLALDAPVILSVFGFLIQVTSSFVFCSSLAPSLFCIGFVLQKFLRLMILLLLFSVCNDLCRFLKVCQVFEPWVLPFGITSLCL